MSNDALIHWQGRVDAEDGDRGLRMHQVVQTFTPETSDPGICLLGLASDLGVAHNQGRIGAAEGPTALRQALASLAWHFNKPLFDAGDIAVIAETNTDSLADAQSRYADVVTQALSSKQFVIGLGGGHEIGWASYQGCRRFLDQNQQQSTSIGILNFDAHFDLRKPAPGAAWAGSSGTPFYQVSQDCRARGQEFHYACMGINPSANTRALFDYAENQQVDFLYDTECTIDDSVAVLEGFLAKIDTLYVTLCLDVLPAGVAPGVSAPAALGIDLGFIINSLNQVKQLCDQHQVHWMMADIAELNPKYDIDQRTAKVAARLVFEIIELNQG
ncbi:MAG: formimidoylglutamase [Pseudomonadota bacterium]